MYDLDLDVVSAAMVDGVVVEFGATAAQRKPGHYRQDILFVLGLGDFDLLDGGQLLERHGRFRGLGHERGGQLAVDGHVVGLASVEVPRLTLLSL